MACRLRAAGAAFWFWTLKRNAERATMSNWRAGVIAISAALSFSASVARAQAYADPAGSGAIVGAAHWIQGTLLGTVATVVAVVAVAVVGLLMLTGRMNWRYGATVILGCFIVFGAASIVAGIQATANSGY
jgi:type IV secretion system protein VirB2